MKTIEFESSVILIKPAVFEYFGEGRKSVAKIQNTSAVGAVMPYICGFEVAGQQETENFLKSLMAFNEGPFL